MISTYERPRFSSESTSTEVSLGCLWIALLTLVLVCGPAVADDAAEPIVWKTGRALEQELDRPVNMILNRTTPRAVVSRLRELHHIALLVDRRIDPDRTIDVQFTQMPLDEALQVFAAQLDGELARIGGTLYIGPVSSTDRLRTLIAVATQQTRAIEGESSTIRKFDLFRGTTITWDDLAEPDQTLDEAAAAFHVKRSPDSAVPHDLWGRGAMADVNAAEAFGLLLGQFDLTFEWQDEGTSIRIVPAPESVTVEQSHTPRTMTPAEAIERIRQQWPHLAPRMEEGEVVLRATSGEHDAVDALLSPPRPDESTKPPQVPLSRRRFTLTAPRAEAIALLRTLQTQGIMIDYDANQLQAAGIDLRTRVSLKLDQATAKELFTQLCEPLGLSFEIDDTTVRLSPK